jgi:hypothetical protein
MSEVQITKQAVQVDQTSTKVIVDLSLNSGPTGPQGIQGPAGPAGPTGPAGTYTPISPITITGTQIGLDTSKVVMIQPSSTQTIQGGLNATGQFQLTGVGSNNGIVIGGDTVLYRSAANVIRTDDMVYIYRPTSGDIGLSITQTNTNPVNFVIQNTGKMEWGNGTGGSRDTNLYRNSAGELKTDGKISASSVTTSGDVTVGSNLNAANIQITDKTITVASTALNSSSTDGAGFVAGAWSSGTKPSILWDNANSRWISSKPIAANIVGNADTATTASKVSNALTIGTGSGLSLSSGTTYDGSALKSVSVDTSIIAPLASPTFTGTITINQSPFNTTAGFVKNTSGGVLSTTAKISASDFVSQSAGTGVLAYAATGGSADVPTFRVLSASDIPTLDKSKITNTAATLTDSQALSNKTLTLSAGSTSVSPIQFTLSPNTLTTPVAGAMEVDSSGVLYYTQTSGAGNRKTVAFTDQTITLSGGDVTGSGTASSISANLVPISGLVQNTYNNSATAITPLTIDNKGRITATGNAITITPAWSSIGSKPTTVSGFGITDAATVTTTTISGDTLSNSITKSSLTKVGPLSSGAGTAFVKTDASGNLTSDSNAYITGSSPAITTPAITTSINDVNNNKIIGLSPTASATNYINVANNTTALISTTTSTTLTSAANQPVLQVASTIEIIIGMTVTAPSVTGIPSNTKVSSIGSGTVTLSNNLTQTIGTSVVLNFTDFATLTVSTAGDATNRSINITTAGNGTAQVNGSQIIDTSALTSNNPGFFCRLQDSTASTASMTHQVAYYVRFTCPSLMTVTKTWVNVTVAAGTGSQIQHGIYSGSGSYLISNGALNVGSTYISPTATGPQSGILKTGGFTLYPGVSYFAAIWVSIASGTLTLSTITPPTPYWSYNNSLSNAIGFNQTGQSGGLQISPSVSNYLTSGLPLIAFSVA